jgi:hypothetical protein
MYSRALLVCILSSVALPGGAHAQENARERPFTVHVARVFGWRHVEEAELELTRADGSPNDDAVRELSILARPHDVDRPTEEAIRAHARDERFVADGIRRLDPGLAIRVERLSRHFPGRRIEIVSGFRPRARSTSRHRHGRALDLRVDGIAKERVTEVARSLPSTGVGYYPNSHFTHIDVRESSYYWVDRSGPGERPSYGSWPPPNDEVRETRETVVASVRDALRGLDAGDGAGAGAGAGEGAVAVVAGSGSGSASESESGSGSGSGADSGTETDSDTVAVAVRGTDTVADTATAAESGAPVVAWGVLVDDPDADTPTTTFADFRRGPRARPAEPAGSSSPAESTEDADVEHLTDAEYERLRREIRHALDALRSK